MFTQNQRSIYLAINAPDYMKFQVAVIPLDLLSDSPFLKWILKNLLTTVLPYYFLFGLTHFDKIRLFVRFYRLTIPLDSPFSNFIVFQKCGSSTFLVLWTHPWRLVGFKLWFTVHWNQSFHTIGFLLYLFISLSSFHL